MVDCDDGRSERCQSESDSAKPGRFGEPCLVADSQSLANLGLMMKYWNVGTVKTRLAETIGFQKAARLHRLFVHHLCCSLAQAGRSRCLILSPDDHLDTLRSDLNQAELADAWTVSAQGGGDLGRRMQRWFANQLNQDHATSAVLIGADCPLLAECDIQKAFDALKQADVVLGPAVDGGYYLIGIRSVTRLKERLSQLFSNVPWSTPAVMDITRQRVEQCGLSLAVLDDQEDIDTIMELNRLRQHLKYRTGRLAELGESIEIILGLDDSTEAIS